MAEASERSTVLLAGERAYAELVAALDQLPADALVHGDDGAPWTVRDVYTHLYRWHVWTVEAIAKSLATGELIEAYADEQEMEDLNARWQAESAGMALAAAKDRCEDSHRRMVDAFRSLSDEDWARWGSAYGAEFDGSHYRGHLGYIKGG